DTHQKRIPCFIDIIIQQVRLSSYPSHLIPKLRWTDRTQIQLIKQLVLHLMRKKRRRIRNSDILERLFQFLKIQFKNHITIIEDDILYILHIFFNIYTQICTFAIAKPKKNCRAYSSVG